MELTFAQQSTAFLWSLVLGLLLGVLYGIIKFLRTAFRLKKLSTFVCDFCFMLIYTFSVFLFCLGYLNGYIRLYVIFGSLLTFLLYRLTVGKMLFKIYHPIIRFFYQIGGKISAKFKIFAKKLLKIAHKILYNKSGIKVFFRRKSKTIDDKRTENGRVEKKAAHQKSAGSRSVPSDRRKGRRSQGS